MAILDAVVVGAGAAGLVTARHLVGAGLAVRVLEARHRVGGRAWTEQDTFGAPVDRGCAWLHSADRNPWTPPVEYTEAFAGLPLGVANKVFFELTPAQGGLEAAAREELVRLFGADLGRRIRRSTATAWVGDPRARGSYSAARPGFAHCRKVLARPVAERVFFAGDACTIDTFGAIHGAWASGTESARRLVTALKGRPHAPAVPAGEER